MTSGASPTDIVARPAVPGSGQGDRSRLGRAPAPSGVVAGWWGKKPHHHDVLAVCSDPRVRDGTAALVSCPAVVDRPQSPKPDDSPPPRSLFSPLGPISRSAAYALSRKYSFAYMIVLRAWDAGDLAMDLNEQTDNSHPVRDRFGRLTTSFDVVLADAGIQGAKIQPRCRKANCYAERLVGPDVRHPPRRGGNWANACRSVGRYAGRAPPPFTRQGGFHWRAYVFSLTPPVS